MTSRRVYLAAIVLALGTAAALRHPSSLVAQSGPKPPAYQVDPFWPKPLPTVKDADGLSHAWVTGEHLARGVPCHLRSLLRLRLARRNGNVAANGEVARPAGEA